MNHYLDHPISVSFDRVAPLLSQAEASSIDVDELFQSLGLSPVRQYSSKKNTISLADYYRIQNRLSILFGDETLQLSTRQLLPGSTDFVLQHVSDCKSLFDVMRVVARSYNLLHGGEYNSVLKNADGVDYIIDDRTFTYVSQQSSDYIYFQIECILIFLHCILMIVSPDAEGAVTALNIRRRTPGGDCSHLGYWAAPIRFGCETYKISFDRDAMLQGREMPPIEKLTSNAVYQKIVEAVAGRHAKYDRINSTASLVRDALARGVVEQADVAAQMGVSSATLRRRLTNEGAGFRELRREVLNDAAKRMLRDRHSVADVSEALGFSEFRAFSRAFKDWNGITPKAFARAAPSGEDG